MKTYIRDKGASETMERLGIILTKMKDGISKIILKSHDFEDVDADEVVTKDYVEATRDGINGILHKNGAEVATGRKTFSDVVTGIPVSPLSGGIAVEIYRMDFGHATSNVTIYIRAIVEGRGAFGVCGMGFRQTTSDTIDNPTLSFSGIGVDTNIQFFVQDIVIEGKRILRLCAKNLASTNEWVGCNIFDLHRGTGHGAVLDYSHFGSVVNPTENDLILGVLE